MLLAIDIGNSNIVWGVFDGAKLLADWRVGTDHSKTTDEYAILLLDLLRLKDQPGSRGRRHPLERRAPADPALRRAVRDLLHCLPLVVSHELESGLTIKYTNPREVGSDRIVNAAAAYRHMAASSSWISDRTTSAQSRPRESTWVAPSPRDCGSPPKPCSTGREASKIELLRPKTAIGPDTVTSMQSGLIFGYAGLVDELVRRIQQELVGLFRSGDRGLAGLIAPESRTIREVRPHLTLERLALIYARTGRPNFLLPQVFSRETASCLNYRHLMANVKQREYSE